MLFQSSLRRELARAFGGTLIVLVTVAMTMTLIRTLGQAALGRFNPQDVTLIMGYTVLAYLPTLLTLSLLMAVVATVTRWHRDAEAVIWLGCGLGTLRWMPAILRFAWPVVVAVAALALVAVPWCNQRIDALKAQYEQRGDLDRVEPGQFQESADGDRVFFIEQRSDGQTMGQNVFIATRQAQRETITSAQRGWLAVRPDGRYVMLENGQRLERTLPDGAWTQSTFSQYGVRVADGVFEQPQAAPNTLSTWQLLASPRLLDRAELTWRLGLIGAAFNLCWVGLAAMPTQPRQARTRELAWAFFAFVVYFNLLSVGQSWVASGRVHWLTWLLVLHGGVLILAVGALLVRQQGWSLPRRWQAQPSASSAS